jgi:hypothetical protein
VVLVLVVNLARLVHSIQMAALAGTVLLGDQVDMANDFRTVDCTADDDDGVDQLDT